MHFENNTGTLRFSPSDLTVFLESEFASWMDRWSLENSRRSIPTTTERIPFHTALAAGQEWKRDELSDEQRVMVEEGMAHERAFLNSLKMSITSRVRSQQAPECG